MPSRLPWWLWPYTAWLIASSNYASSFTMTRQWSVSKKTPERPLDSKETKLFNLKGHSHWILVRRTDAETEISVFWSSDVNNWLIGKVPDAGKDWGQKEKRVSLDEMDGWYHWCNRHEFGQTSGDVEGQGGPECCSPWGQKELDITGQLNNSNNIQLLACVTFILYVHPLMDTFVASTLWLLWIRNTGVQIYLELLLSTLLGIYPVIAGSYGNSMFNFFEKAPCHFPQWLYHFIFLPPMHKGSNFSTSLPILVFCILKIFNFL